MDKFLLLSLLCACAENFSSSTLPLKTAANCPSAGSLGREQACTLIVRTPVCQYFIKCIHDTPASGFIPP